MTISFKDAGEIRETLKELHGEVEPPVDSKVVDSVRDWIRNTRAAGYPVRWLTSLEHVIELALSAEEPDLRRWSIAFLSFLFDEGVGSTGTFGLADFYEIEYALGFVVARLRERLEDPSVLSPFNPKPPEHIREQTLKQLIEYLEDPLSPDDTLLEAVDRHLEETTRTSKSPFVRRLRDRVERFSAIISNDPNSEDAGIARAALTYFVEVDDAIDDSAGPAGLIDDAFALEVADEDLGLNLSWLYDLLDPGGETLNLGRLPLESRPLSGGDGNENSEPDKPDRRFEVPEFVAANVGVVHEAAKEGAHRLSVVTKHGV